MSEAYFVSYRKPKYGFWFWVRWSVVKVLWAVTLVIACLILNYLI